MIKQNTHEWLEMRKGKIGASDAPIIMKISPFKTPYRLWQEKLSLVEPETNAAMQRGHELEPMARAALEDTLDMPLRSKIKLHNQRSWMMASMDAISFDERTVAEIKCPGKADHETALSGLVPEKYFPQLQHQMEVCDVEMAYYFSYSGTGDNALVKVYRDDKYIKTLLVAEEKFWECMNNQEAPELMPTDYNWKDGAKWAKLAERYQEIKKLIAEQEIIKEQLIAMAEGKNARGGGIYLTKCLRKGTIEYSKIPELKGIDLESYRKKSIEYWKIT